MQSGSPRKPYHDTMAYVTGPVVREVQHLFVDRWRAVTGEPLELPNTLSPEREPLVDGALPIDADKVVLSRTCHARGKQLNEVRNLFERAVQSAERVIYLETQYLTSRAFHDALLERLQDSTRPGVDVVVMMPDDADTPKERIALGAAQDRVLHSLASAAARSRSRFRAFVSRPAGSQPTDPATFIHSKVLLVDDRFICVGSANATNRSLSLDSELCLAFESPGLNPSLAALRSNLLAEHCGLTADAELFRSDGLIDRLDELTERAETRLRPRVTAQATVALETTLHLERLFDPDKPLDEVEFSEVFTLSFTSSETAVTGET
jgi:phosphatidylserine/phosphatidylglycerophosphate/cardiolipin synthase-like enzyme